MDDQIEDFFEEEDPTQPVIEVVGPSGASYQVMTEAEKAYYEQISAKYLADNHFPNVSDLQELDRVLLMELMCHRWSQWQLNERDYDGERVDLKELQKNIKDNSQEIRLLKKSLGLDKATRDKEKGSSVADYIHNLGLRAKEFGVVRNQQAVEAITLWKELEGKVTLYLNCTPDERTEFHAHESDVINWIIEQFPKFNEIDEQFRATSQKYWIRDV